MSDPVRRSGRERRTPSLALVITAFACVYIIWGSTYLAIRVVVQTLPPLLAAGIRFVVAGGVLYGWLRWRHAARPTRVHWRSAAIVGGLLLLGGNGGVMLAETMIDSGVAALLVASVPMWMVLLNALRPGGVRPNAAEVVGLAVGFLGVWLLIRPQPGAGGVPPVGAACVLLGSLFWSAGSLYSRHAPLPGSAMLSTAMQMLTGGSWLLLAGGMRGELHRLHPAGWSPGSALALLYLVIFGSLIAFNAYIWLLRVSTPARVGTYAYVNPAVAVVLGWLLLNEPIRPAMLPAMGLIVLAVAVITAGGRRTPAGDGSGARIERAAGETAAPLTARTE